MLPTNIACIAFTQNGERLAEKVRRAFDGAVDVLTKDSYKAELPQVFETFDGIVFIASTGIAVRLSAPFLQDKTRDPAVVVVDDLGRYAISLISGHLGGANALAEEIASFLGCQPIITTASDGRGFEAVDLFAQRNHLIIENPEDAKTITAMMVDEQPCSAMMVDEQPITLKSEIPVIWNYPYFVEQGTAGYVYITSQHSIVCDLPYCILRPRNLNVGIGCRRGKTHDEILAAIKQVFQVHNLSLKSIKALATVDIKRDEQGLIEAGDTLQRPIKCYTKEEIQQVQHRFAASAFVQSTIGISGVCEPCAYLAGGEIIVGKTVINGITIAVAKE
jgi:cobalt-precorrin 5A hydrolase